MPAETLKRVPAPTIKPVTSTAPSNITENLTFSVDDFDVQQLPEQGKEEATTDTKSVAGGSKSTSTTKEAKGIDVSGDESPQHDEGVQGDEATVASGEAAAAAESEPTAGEEDTKEEVESKLPKFLKPPKGAEGEVKIDTKGEVKPIVPKPGARDMSGFTAEEAFAAKQMSNEAFGQFKKAVQTVKELQSLKETVIMQHPQAYVLDPGYQQVRTDLQYAQKEAGYWEQQLVNMDDGQELVPITGFNAQTGEPVLGQAIKPTKALEERVRMMIMNCYNAAQRLQGKLQEYPAKYQQNIKTDLGDIENYRKQQFGWVTDPKLLDYSINVEGLGDRTLKQIREDVQGILPRWMHSHPLAPVLGDLVIALRLKQAELAEATSTQQVAQTKKDEADLVEPSSKSKGTSKGKGPKVHGMDEFIVDPSLGI